MVGLAGAAGKVSSKFSSQAAPPARPIAVTETRPTIGTPAIAADAKGNVYVAWDSYENGNYDVFMRRFTGPKRQPVDSGRRHAGLRSPAQPGGRRQDRVWIAYELGGPNWGKDYGRVVPASAPVGGKAKPRRSRIGHAVRPRRPGGLWPVGDGVGMPLVQCTPG